MVDAERIQALQAFLADVDWDLVEEVAETGGSAVRYLRGQPWGLIAAGAALVGLGLWDLLGKANHAAGRQPAHVQHTAWSDEDAYDVMAP